MCSATENNGKKAGKVPERKNRKIFSLQYKQNILESQDEWGGGGPRSARNCGDFFWKIFTVEEEQVAPLPPLIDLYVRVPHVERPAWGDNLTIIYHSIAEPYGTL